MEDLIVAIPIIVIVAIGMYFIANKAPKGVLLVVGIIMYLLGRFMSSHFSQTFGLEGKMIHGSFLNRVLSASVLPLQILGFIATIHGIIIVFKKRNQKANKISPANR